MYWSSANWARNGPSSENLKRPLFEWEWYLVFRFLPYPRFGLYVQDQSKSIRGCCQYTDSRNATGTVWRQHLWVQIGWFDKRVFLAHRNHWGVEHETDNWNTQKPWREDRQRHQTRDAQAVFIWREDQDCLGWASWRGQHRWTVSPWGHLSRHLSVALILLWGGSGRIRSRKS